MLEVRHLKKEYRTKKGAITKALDDVSLVFPEKGMVFILGKSGSGKSTLLNVCGGLDKYDSGEIIIKGRSSSKFSAQDFDSYRNTYVGFVFQEYNILDEFTVEENIALALELQNKKRDKATIDKILADVDMTQFAARKPNTLSGGQKQRVAIARALVKEPEIIMADEPTGALDSKTGQQVFDTLKKLSKDKLVLVVSHDREFAEQYGDRIIELKDGVVISDMVRSEVDPDAKNVKFYGTDTVCVTNGAEITDEDMSRIKTFLQKAQGSAIITTSREQVRVAKETQPELDIGEFETIDKQPTPQTYPEQKLIRSRFPLRHAIRVGASGLKTKPVRLVFTLLLSIVAFIMFGLASTVMLFDKTKVTVESLATAGDEYISFGKGYRYTYTQYYNGEVDYQDENVRDTNYTYEEYEALKAKYAGSIATVGSSYNSIRFENINMSQNVSSFYSSEARNVAIYDSSIKFLAGREPKAADEIAITDYMFKGYALTHTKFMPAHGGENAEKLTFNSYSDIVNETAPIELKYSYYNENGNSQTVYLKIVGVVDTGFDNGVPSKFSTLKEKADNNAPNDDYMLYSEWNNSVSNSLMNTPVVTSEFVATYILPQLKYNGQSNVEYFEGINMLGATVIAEESDRTYRVGGISKCVQDSKEPHFDIYNFDGQKLTSLNGNNIAIASSVYAPIVLFRLDRAYGAQIEAWNNRTYSPEYVNMKNGFMQEYENEHPYTQPERVDGMTDWDYEMACQDARFAYDSAKEIYVDEKMKEAYPKPAAIIKSDLESEIRVRYETEHPAPEKNDGMSDDEFQQVVSAYYEARDNYINEKMLENGFASYVANYLNRGNIPADKQKTIIETLVAECKAADVDTAVSFKINNEQDNNNTDVTVGGVYYPTERRYADVYSDIYAYVSDTLYDTFSSNLWNNKNEWYSEETTKYVENPDAYISAVFIPAKGERDIIAELYNATQVVADDDSTVVIKNSIMNTLEMAIEMVEMLGTVFLWVGVGLAVFAFLLMFNFISASISAKKKEIGILRAIGARSVDVFKIFISEALIISLICIVVALGGTIALCYVINGIVAENMSIALFVFGPLSVVFIVGIALVTAFISTIIPVANYSKKPPISSIRAL